MVSKRIKYARAHLSSKKHIALLAIPLWRRTQTTDFNTLPQPFTVPRSALKAYATKRIRIMARPKVLKMYQRRTRDSQGSLQGNRDREGDKMSKSNKRLQELALPKKSQLLRARMYTISLGNRNQTQNINNLLKGIRKSRYQSYRIICNTLQQRVAAREKKIKKKLFKALTSSEDWERHNKALKKLAAPKHPRAPSQPPAQKEEKRIYSSAYMEYLARPMHVRRVDSTDPFSVKQSALTYVISERMRKLAREKTIPDPPFNVPGAVNPQALLVEPSPRIAELAKAIVRPLGLETHHNMDAFSVSPLALKAKCSPRLKILAKPKKRPK